MIKFRIDITGTADLLMHNARLANPLDPVAQAVKKLAGKRNKTIADYEELARIEHAGGMYLDPDVGPYLPSDNIWRSLYDGAKKHKLGVRVKEGVMFPGTVNPLAYNGPRDVDGLWADENFRLTAVIKVGVVRTPRCRARFRNWRTSAEGVLDPNVIDFAQLATVAVTSGELIGLGDWRPRYGCYQATLEQL